MHVSYTFYRVLLIKRSYNRIYIFTIANRYSPVRQTFKTRLDKFWHYQDIVCNLLVLVE